MTANEIYEILTREIGTIPEEEEAAQKWFKDAYNKGSVDVQKALLELLIYNVIKPFDNNERIMWIFRTVFHGNEDYKKELRSLYYEGHGEDSIRKEIIDYFRDNALNNEDLDSIIFMGHIHTAGFGVEKSMDIAHKWYHKAAKKGNAGAQLVVADYHFHKEEYNHAYSWYHEAALQNKKTAWLRLSRMYKLGLGVEVNEEKALFYKNKAISTIQKEENTNKVSKIRHYKPKSRKHEKR